ncbi:hypothetical protein KI387_024641 [Taxus chinensis]|uniref:Two-component response regulator n=1 Tax=Taxus chinensis TaxID=29808 RepID=A0AA38G3H2_TAXCH|nr:hypothetical protein KI387_024641 [Taxus chinensis]
MKVVFEFREGIETEHCWTNEEETCKRCIAHGRSCCNNGVLVSLYEGSREENASPPTSTRNSTSSTIETSGKMSITRVDGTMIPSMKHPPQFSPKGLRVLLVDDNPFFVDVMGRMLRECEYNVTMCTRVSQAIYLLKKNRGTFDIVMSEVFLPEEGGFQLLEIAGLGFGLPVILMSAMAETSVVMRGVTHGACDFLIKPIRMEELRNIWQHVIRRRQDCKISFNLLDDSGGDESSDGGGTVDSKKRKDKAQAQESDGRKMIEDISGLKKARVHWTVQLHQQFVKAVNQLQIDKAVPKKILDIMKVQGLTRENVASHLQKYRLYLRRLSGINSEPRPVASFQAAGNGIAGGSMQIRQGGRKQIQENEEHQSLLSPSALNNGGAGAAISSRRSGSPGIDKATLISLHQYRAYQQKQAAGDEAQTISKGGLDIEPAGGLSRKTRKRKRSAAAVKTEHVDTTRISTKTQYSFPSFADSTGKSRVTAREGKEQEKISLWNDTEDLFLEKFAHEYDLPNLSAAAAAQDFMSTASAPDISDYFIDDLLAQSHK